MPKHLVLSVMSHDRVGIIAAVTRAVYELNGNIGAISQTVMRGYFTIILTLDFAEDVALDAVRMKVAESGRPGELEVSVRTRDTSLKGRPVVKGGEQFVLTIMGEDCPGIISRISSYLASRSINIVDLYAYTEEDRFVLISQVMVPLEQDIQLLQIDLEKLWNESALTVKLLHENIFVATNEIDFRHSKAGVVEL